MIKRLNCKIKGRVQGISFRDFVREKAFELRIAGTVENEKDSSVKVVAEGEEIKLLKFVELLKKGSPFSDISGVEVQFGEAKGSFSDFSILY